MSQHMVVRNPSRQHSSMVSPCSACLVCLAVVMIASPMCLPANAQELRGRDEGEKELLQGDEAPWLEAGQTPRLPAVAQTSPMDALVGVEASEFERLVDGDPLEHEDETILKVLYRVPQMGLDSVADFVQQTDGIGMDALVEDPESNRALMFRLDGHATYVERLLVSPDLAERYEYTHCFKVLVEMPGNQPSVIVLARQVPAGWPLNETISEPVRVDSLFLRLVANEDELAASPEEGEQGEADVEANVPTAANAPTAAGVPLLIASRVEWYPSPGEHVGDAFPAGVYWLAQNGLDCSLWEPIARSDGKALGAEDSECFYQGLAAIQRSEAQVEAPPAPQELELFALLRAPDDVRGERFRIEGNVRRITRVEVGQEYFSKRTGIDHYYQIDMFVRLKDNQIITMPMSDGSEGPVFKNKYPITLCVPSLPDGLEPTDDINVQVSAKGYFFKLWAYPSQYVEQFDPNIRQKGPLFLGHDLVVQETTASPNTLTIIAAVVLIASLGGAWFGAWALGRKGAQPIKKADQDEGDPGWLKTLEEQDRSGADADTDSP